MSFDWIASEYDRGTKYECATPFGSMIVVDDNVLRMCTAHPVKGYVSVGNALTVVEAMEMAEACYRRAIREEYYR